MNSACPDARLSPWFALGRVELVLALLLWLLPFSATAREAIQGSYVDLSNSRGLLVAIEAACDRTAIERVRNRFGVDRARIEVLQNPGEIGAVSIYGATTHVFYFGQSANGYTIVEISSPVGPLGNAICRHLLVFDRNAHIRKIRSSFPGGEAISRLSDEQQSYMQDVLKKCKSMGASAKEYFAGGEFEIVPGTDRVVDPGRFSCEAAAKNSVAAIDIELRSSKVRVVAVHDRLYLSEVGKR